MYNPQLNTFFTVAETGSFAKASQKLYISSSAVLQQVNLLEKHLGVKLFERSNHGLKLTPAGEYLYNEIPHLKAWSETISIKLGLLANKTSGVLKVLLPKMHRNRFFYEFWTMYSSQHPEAAIEFVEAPNDRSQELFEFYSRLDIVEFPKTDISWQNELSFLPICSVPVALAVPMGHHLADERILSPDALSGEHILVHEGTYAAKLEPCLERLRAVGAEITEVPSYNMSVIARCILEKKFLLVPACSGSLHPSMRTIRCDWDISLPYGFFYSLQASLGDNSFIAFVKEQLARDNIEVPW